MDPRLNTLSQELRSIVWVLKAIIGDSSTFCTGFCVQSDGLIITCAHGMHENDFPNLWFKARRIDDDGFKYKARVVSQFPNWDITILRIDRVAEEFKAGDFASGAIDEGDPLMLIGHPHLLVGSFLVGYAQYPCSADASIPSNDNLTCLKYESTASSTTPPYRVMGHVLNKEVFRKNQMEGSVYIDDLRNHGNIHPLVPIIQIKNLGAGPAASGAPLFNIQGKIVGLHVYDAFGYYTAIHVSLLREAVRIASGKRKR